MLTTINRASPHAAAGSRASAMLASCTGRMRVRAAVMTDQMKQMMMAAMERESNQTLSRIGIDGFSLKPVESEGTGLFLWEAGIQLAAFLRSSSLNVNGARVLELGSGSGMVGLTCACSGAHATLSDLPGVLRAAEVNADTNAHIISANGGSVAVGELDWNNTSSPLAQQQWDFIVGSDLVYEPFHPTVLAPLLVTLLRSNPQAKVLLGHAHRGKELDADMEGVFAQHGLGVQELQRTCERAEEQDVSILSVFMR